MFGGFLQRQYYLENRLGICNVVAAQSFVWCRKQAGKILSTSCGDACRLSVHLSSCEGHIVCWQETEQNQVEQKQQWSCDSRQSAPHVSNAVHFFCASVVFVQIPICRSMVHLYFGSKILVRHSCRRFFQNLCILLTDKVYSCLQLLTF